MSDLSRGSKGCDAVGKWGILGRMDKDGAALGQRERGNVFGRHWRGELPLAVAFGVAAIPAVLGFFIANMCACRPAFSIPVPASSIVT